MKRYSPPTMMQRIESDTMKHPPRTRMAAWMVASLRRLYLANDTEVASHAPVLQRDSASGLPEYDKYISFSTNLFALCSLAIAPTNARKRKKRKLVPTASAVSSTEKLLLGCHFWTMRRLRSVDVSVAMSTLLRHINCPSGQRTKRLWSGVAAVMLLVGEVSRYVVWTSNDHASRSITDSHVAKANDKTAKAARRWH